VKCKKFKESVIASQTVYEVGSKEKKEDVGGNTPRTYGMTDHIKNKRETLGKSSKHEAWQSYPTTKLSS